MSGCIFFPLSEKSATLFGGKFKTGRSSDWQALGLLAGLPVLIRNGGLFAFVLADSGGTVEFISLPY